MDFGSGFWTIEDAAPVGELAEVCGFEGDERIFRYLERERQLQAERDERAARYAENQEVHAFNLKLIEMLPREALINRDAYHRAMEDHEHVFSSRGNCMWADCGVRLTGEISAAPEVLE